MIVVKRILLSLLLVVAASAMAADALTLSKDEQEIVELTNAARKEAGLQPVRPNPKLFEAARNHSRAMAQAEKLEHVLNGKNSSARIGATGYKWSATRENIAWNQRDAKEAVKAWLESPHHRENLLANDITEIGVGIAKDAKGQPYYTQDFAQRAVDLVTVKFTIRNRTNLEFSVDLHANKPGTMLPAETVFYTLSTFGEPPAIGLKSGSQRMELKVSNGGKYRVEQKGAGFEIFMDSAK